MPKGSTSDILLQNFSEGHGQQHFEALEAEHRVRNALGHDERFARLENVLHAADGELSRTVKHRDHGIAARGMRGDFLSLVKGEDRPDQLVLHERLAYALPRAVLDQIRQMQLGLLFDVFIYSFSSFILLYLIDVQISSLAYFFRRISKNQKHSYSCRAFYSPGNFAKQLAARNRRSNSLPTRSLRWRILSEFVVQSV